MEEYRMMVVTAAKEAEMLMRARALRGVYDPLRLYVVPSTATAHGRLVWVDTAAPSSAIPIRDAVLTCGVPYGQYFAWTYRHARNAPLFPTGATCA